MLSSRALASERPSVCFSSTCSARSCRLGRATLHHGVFAIKQSVMAHRNLADMVAYRDRNLAGMVAYRDRHVILMVTYNT